MKSSIHPRRAAFSLLELLAVVTILGIIAAIIVPRVTFSSDTAKQRVEDHHKATINAAIERYYIDKNTWPTLADLGSDPDYFPEGIPVSPVNGTAYTLNSTTHRVD